MKIQFRVDTILIRYKRRSFQFQDKMEEMQQHNMSWIEVQFLKKAVDILCECRRTLMYTYVFAYYLRKNNQSEIFEVGFQFFLDLIIRR